MVSTKDNQLFSLQEDEVSLPKPDLAIFFKLESLSDNPFGSIPNDLNYCLRPDNVEGERCFPFLFMEV